MVVSKDKITTNFTSECNGLLVMSEAFSILQNGTRVPTGLTGFVWQKQGDRTT